MKIKNILFIFSFLIIFSSFLTFCEDKQEVLILKFFETITLGHYEILKEAIEYSKNNKVCCIIILLDTYGGRLDATFEIVKLIDRSEVPIISFVYPEGATAWSAGTLILVSSHISAMSYNTVIGSMQPVYKDLSINESKIINSLIIFTKERMKKHNRNESVVEKFIVENLNLNAEEALKIKVIDIVAKDISELLEKINGRKIFLKDREVAINITNVKVKEFLPSLKSHLIKIISDPTIASMLLLIGIYSIIFGISSPGISSEIIGVILIVLALIGLGTNINYLSIFLIIFGISLLLYEIFTPSFGIIGISGIISLTIGIILLPTFSSEIYFIEKEAIKNEIFLKMLPMITIISSFFTFVIYKVLEVKSKKPQIGDIIGKIGIATENISKNKIGWIKIENELWKAKTLQKIKKGEKVKVIKKENGFLIVEKLNQKI